MSVLLQANRIQVEFGSLVAVRDLSFELAGGELLGLIGPNGAGKTTLLRVMAGLHAPTSGDARILGKAVLGEHEIVRHHVGFAPDTPPAYEELTIDQFLRFVAGAYGLQGSGALERIDFWVEKLWLEEKRHTVVKDLSRGMRQRVTLARTFLPQPHAILLDEPLGGLDPAGRIQLRKVLAMLREQGCAMIVSSHILSDLEEIATHIAILEHGSLIDWSDVRDRHHVENSRRTYRLRTASHSDDHLATIQRLDGVDGLTRDDNVYTFDFHADNQAVADLVRELVNAGVPLVSFEAVTTSLEETYLRAGLKQVD